ncbi:putative disease resistance protein RGA3 [Silene latifolia]|uniref:putative disease resistance protein RGA3 n=1 Tax=Silene latifolia TaxID=37657 RepID=UPI003D772AC0
MDLATVMSVVQTLLSAIQTLDQLKVMCSFSDCKRELAALQSTVDTIKSVLQDAEAKQDALNNQEKKYIEELKDAVYDANDVVDEFLTLVKRKNLTEASDKVTDKVRSFLSRFKLLTHHLSDKVKQVNKKLETIASNSSKFSFKVDSKPIRFSMEETSSFVPADNKIIGRDEDVEKIVGMLLDSNHVYQSDVSFLSIVGMGGLGKTALAQLVFNDPRIKSAFQLTRWTCIADQDHQLWNLTKLLGKVIMQKKPTSKEQIHREVRKQLGGKKYLLVLDDVWTECYHRWQEFEEFLKVGQSGSRIVVTTRSKKTAQMIGGDRVHELQGLSEEKSWCLFERMAFLPKQRETPNDDLLSLGKNIIKKCAHVPLAIKVVGSLLRGESKAKWKSFEEKGLANMSEGDDTITNVLKLSYRQLDFSLKNCFAYCAIFPKGFEIRKIMLISLWMAQGYINNEYVGEEYFLLLLQRCFFQGVGEDEYGEIERFKIHDLLHDIAEQVAGEEICRLSTDTVNVSKRVRHLSLLCDRDTQESFNKTRIRTYLGVNKDPWSKGNADRVLAGKLVANWTCLRSLDLSRLGAEILPETIGKLFHLRYLNLSESTLKELPTSIAKLVNLQTLDLYRCTNLRELPNDVSKLVDLSTLDITSSGLRHMPPGMGALTRLHTLGLFVAGRECSDGNECFDGLEDLSSLNNLKGYLEICIRICKNANYVKESHGGGNYLKSKEHLKGICIDFTKGEEYGNKESEQLLLEEMQPHHGLKELSITGYRDM